MATRMPPRVLRHRPPWLLAAGAIAMLAAWAALVRAGRCGIGFDE
jgi:hypothetical protein